MKFVPFFFQHSDQGDGKQKSSVKQYESWAYNLLQREYMRSCKNISPDVSKQATATIS